MPYQLEKDEYKISDDPQLLDIAFIHEYLSKESYWAHNIPYETVERSIHN